jgi:histidinol-phosphate aminotransferase
VRRRAFVRSGLAAAIAPALFPLDAARAAPTAPPRPPRRTGPIRLSSNENPLGLPRRAKEAAIACLDEAHRYQRLSGALQEKLAARLGVGTDNLFLGAGSTEVLQMAVQSVHRAGGRAIIADPTFEDVERYARPFAIELVKVPLARDAGHDLDRMRREAERSTRPTLVFLCNPNNPTGTLTSCTAIADWIDAAPDHILFVVDEAYFEYVDAPDYRTFIPDAVARPNLLVCRTFSKIYAMAGLRLGYGVAHADTVRAVRAYAANGSLNQVALAVADAALDDDRFVAATLRSNAAARRVLVDALDALGIEHLPGHTNFVMHRIRGDVAVYNERMREAGFLVGRPFPPLLSYSRVSIGRVEEMTAFVAALREFRAHGWV